MALLVTMVCEVATNTKALAIVRVRRIAARLNRYDVVCFEAGGFATAHATPAIALQHPTAKLSLHSAVDVVMSCHGRGLMRWVRG